MLEDEEDGRRFSCSLDVSGVFILMYPLCGERRTIDERPYINYSLTLNGVVFRIGL